MCTRYHYYKSFVRQTMQVLCEPPVIILKWQLTPTSTKADCLHSQNISWKSLSHASQYKRKALEPIRPQSRIFLASQASMRFIHPNPFISILKNICELATLKYMRVCHSKIILRNQP